MARDIQVTAYLFYKVNFISDTVYITSETISKLPYKCSA
jgi:hypothetical protein